MEGFSPVPRVAATAAPGCRIADIEETEDAWIIEVEAPGDKAR